MPSAVATPVIQEEATGCGIAAVAALAGMTYRQMQLMAASLGISAADPHLWSDTQYVCTMLQHLGFQASLVANPFTSWDALPPTALLAIKWHLERGRPFWHWVVYLRGPDGPEVLDSRKGLRSNRRKDFGRIRPKWFIAVNQTPNQVDRKQR